MNSSTTTAMAHNSMPWMPMATGLPGAGARPSPERRLPREAPGPVQPARPLGEAVAHMPRAGGAAGAGGAGTPRRAAVAGGGKSKAVRETGSGAGAEPQPEHNFPSQPANFKARQRRGAHLGQPAWAGGASMP